MRTHCAIVAFGVVALTSGCATEEPAIPVEQCPVVAPADNERPLIAGIAAGGDNTCALTHDGEVYCWGSNVYGQLGPRTSTYIASPKSMGIGCSKGVQVAGTEMCALREDGTVVCWGAKTDFLGTVLSSGAKVVDGIHGAVQVGVGANSAALLSDGSVLYWGVDFPSDRPSPKDGVLVVDALPTSGAPICVISDGGDVLCWGVNNHGQLGDGTTTNSVTPVKVVGMSNVQELAVGPRHRCARLENGSVYCWGGGALGDGVVRAFGDYSSVPVKVAGMGDAVQIAQTALPVCALRSNGEIWCWSDCEAGVCGSGSSELLVHEPVHVPDVPPSVAIAVGSYHACALTEDNEVYCWGDGYYGQIGNGLSQVSEPQLPQRPIWPWD